MARATDVAPKRTTPTTSTPVTTRTNGSERRQTLDQVGPRLREAREARGLSLREIARRINVSPSFVSQVETGKASPSVGTLYSLVNELGLSLDEVMSEDADDATVPSPPMAPLHGSSGLDVPWETPTPAMWPRIEAPLQRAKGRPTIKLSGVTWERLTHEDDPFVDFLRVSYSPGSASCSEDKLMRHGGREYGHVISGRIDVQVGFELHKLGPGDSLHFDSTTPHRLANPYDEPCVAVWVVVARKGDDRITTPLDPDSNHLPGLI
jgi:transcriptional regulator with XRE-family HTH domain